MRTASAILAAICLAVLAGCGGPAAPSAPVEPVKPLAVATTSPADEVMASVNGKPLYMKNLYEIMIREFGGLKLADQLIAEEVVRQECTAKGISLAVSASDVELEKDSVLLQALGQAPPPAQREQFINALLDKYSLSPEMFEMVLRRQVLLRRLAIPQVKVTQQELDDEFSLQYDRRYIVRDIQVASLQEAEKVQTILKGIKDPKAVEEKFSQLAQELSVGATHSQGGLLPPITARTKDVVPATLRDAAMSMKDGQVSSPIQVGTAYHILYLVGTEAPKNVKFEDVKDKLTTAIRERQIRQLQPQIMGDLITQARKSGKIVYVNPQLKTMDIERLKAAEMQPK